MKTRVRAWVGEPLLGGSFHFICPSSLRVEHSLLEYASGVGSNPPWDELVDGEFLLISYNPIDLRKGN